MALDIRSVDSAENRRRMANGELYYAFTPDLIADRRRCRKAYQRLNNAHDLNRRGLVELWKEVNGDTEPLPAEAATEDVDETLLQDWPWIDTPIHLDYGYNVKLGPNVYVNVNSTWIDTCTITVGARTLIGPNCSFFSGSHPTDPTLRNGTRGPEHGKPITIGEDCWFGGSCIVLPGVTIGRGVTVGAGSVVTKDVPDYVVVAGNPARVLRQLEPSKPSETIPQTSTNVNYAPVS
ncbi:galactoside O-acetyltransferase [Plectosphaerella cucumerina]|uniref:Galactoside O-acetyltransferase n=1 Tax=Plectosphaerella cucumerina TaxID=40658 RepID=A0A8K0TB90_9PEZI|nr:galactoside O-acetyltransferase [Plectosphaerella cucumerina]